MKICNRSEESELLDLGPSHYTSQEFEQCLIQLNRVGYYLGGDKASLWALEQLNRSPNSILDVGSGGGFFTQKLTKKYPEANIVGIDISPEAVVFANQRAKNEGQKNIKFMLSSAEKLDDLNQRFDVIISTLMCHHLNDEQLVNFLKRAYQLTDHALILNDLHRHYLAYAGYALIAPLLFRNRLITHDGRLSIKRGFIRREWIALLNAAEIPLSACSIKWHWPFRWTVIIKKLTHA
jgi:2-polyprenyl-3-methyl-5-hydroxy-6-metoxy-1,4-benzoquinol methylase